MTISFLHKFLIQSNKVVPYDVVTNQMTNFEIDSIYDDDAVKLLNIRKHEFQRR
jgi:hypothetical protein